VKLAAQGRAARIAVLLLSTLLLGGCGGNGRSQLEVSAAASLRKAFTRYGHQFTAATARYSFAGSDALAAQIEQGVRPDVFASANTHLPDTLFARGSWSGLCCSPPTASCWPSPRAPGSPG
jgi:molybdate transport system substrate-binding protein